MAFSTNNLSRQIEKSLSFYTELWWKMPNHFPDNLPIYSDFEQKNKKRKVDSFQKDFFDAVTLLQQNGFTNNLGRSKIQDSIVFFSNEVLDFEQKLIDLFKRKNFFAVTFEFIDRARKFDPKLCVTDIFQACRNALMMHSVQLVLNQKVELTNSILAYSLLYPYTDNFIDNPGISVAQKKEFNVRFKSRLSGENIVATSVHEEKVFSLVKLIEEQYPRKNFPHVFDSLLAIHKAQTESVGLLNNLNSPFEIDILKIIFEKGGTSVLADLYLVNGEAKLDHAEACFGMGVLLQLVDDLQDITEDSKGNLFTIYSPMWMKQNYTGLDVVVNKTFHFSNSILKRVKEFGISEDSNLFYLFLVQSWNQHIIEAVCLNSKYFSKSYVNKLERFYPVNFKKWRKDKKKFIRKFGSIGK